MEGPPEKGHVMSAGPANTITRTERCDLIRFLSGLLDRK